MLIRLLSVWLLVSAIASAEVGAVTEIESTQWYSGCDQIVAYLVARTTATDVAEGVRFSIHERDGDGDGNDVLADVALPWAEPFPPVGTEVRIFIRLEVTVTGSRLAADEISQWQMTWCLPPAPTEVRRSSGPTGLLGSGTTDDEPAHEFVLVDEEGVEGSGPTPNDWLACDVGKARSVLGNLLSPYELTMRGIPFTDDSAWLGTGINRWGDDLAADPTGSLGVAFSADGMDLCGVATVGEPVTMYVVARTAGATTCGIVGTEFRVETIPAGWFATAVSPPGTVAIGDPFDGVGYNVAYMTCQSGASVLFVTAIVLPGSPVTNHPLRVHRRDPPTNRYFECPLVVLCDGPVYTLACVESGPTAYFNPDASTVCEATGVELQTWGRVKSLYK
jgi:hypothetical protein